VGKAISEPNDLIVVSDWLLVGDPGLETLLLASRLVGVLATREELVFTVLGDPDVVAGKVGTSISSRLGVSKNALGSWHVDLVADRAHGDGVHLVLVDDLERTALLDVEVGKAFLLDVGADGPEANTVRVDLLVLFGLERQRNNVVVHKGVLVAVNHGVDTDREKMLMMGSQDTGRNDSSVRAGLVGINVLGRQDAAGADLEVKSACLIELPVDHVLVVGNGQDAVT
jgi:hypothetical protein